MITGTTRGKVVLFIIFEWMERVGSLLIEISSEEAQKGTS